ncbi:MAG: NAD(P)/FAD-dependent oxidoreductase [Chloroflexota bacterium]
MYDAIIVGGGPAGSHLAGRLADAGYKVMVLDRKRSLDIPVCCTGIISLDCVRSYGVDESLILRRMSSARFFSPSGKELYLKMPGPLACVVDRAALNAAFAQRAQIKGVEYVLNSRVEDISVCRESAGVTIAGQRGVPDHIEARVVIIAGGFASKLAKTIGQGWFADSITGAQTEVEIAEVDETEIYFGREVARGFFAWLVPTVSGKALVGLLSRRDPGQCLKDLVSALTAQGKIISATGKITYGGIPLVPLPRTYGDRRLVVGTAAGQVKPTTGGGIYYGLLCADIAADCLLQALEKDSLLAKDLAGYERNWRKKLAGELRIGYRARRIYEWLSDGQIDQVFDIIKDNGIDKALLEADDLAFDWHGNVVLRLLRQKVLANAFKAMKVPFLAKR